MYSIGVYLGASKGNRPAISDAVVRLGEMIVEHRLRLVYGGSSKGLMGMLADTVKDAGGVAVGIITKYLMPSEKPSERLDALHIVESMAERKFMLKEESDMFLVMPGGLGTVEEAMDTWNAIKLGLLCKPLGFFNPDGYFDGLFKFIETCEKSGLVAHEHAHIPLIDSDIEAVLNSLIERL